MFTCEKVGVKPLLNWLRCEFQSSCIVTQVFDIKHREGLANVVLSSHSLKLESTMSIASLGKVIVCDILETRCNEV